MLFLCLRFQVGTLPPLQIPLLYPGAMRQSVLTGDQGLVDQKRELNICNTLFLINKGQSKFAELVLTLISSETLTSFGP